MLLCLHCWQLIEGSSSARETLGCGMSSCGIVWHRHLIVWHRHRVASHRLASSASGVASSSHRIASPTCAGASHRFAWMRKTHVIASHRIARPRIRSQSYRLVAFLVHDLREYNSKACPKLQKSKFLFRVCKIVPLALKLSN